MKLLFSAFALGLGSVAAIPAVAPPTFAPADVPSKIPPFHNFDTGLGFDAIAGYLPRTDVTEYVSTMQILFLSLCFSCVRN